MIRDREIQMVFDVEERDGSRIEVARIRLPAKVARNLTEGELPSLDRPIRFVVLRGQRGAIRADTIDELQEELDKPWSPDEIEPNLDNELAGREEREVRKIAREFQHRKPPKRGNRGRQGGNDRSRRHR
jgi:ATP-dependent helicase HrpA